MLFIDKFKEPPELTNLKESAISNKLTPKEAYNTLRNPLKRNVIDSLMREQGAVCAYCACRLPDNRVENDNIARVTIEHWYPVGENNIPGESHGLDYNNMMVVCAGNQGPRKTRRTGELTCDSKRGKRLLKVNPLNTETLKHVWYTSDGVIYSNDKEIQDDLDVKLNLNCISAGIYLPLQRKMVLNEVQSKVLSGDMNDLEWCNKILNAIKKKPYIPYSDAAVWWLEKHIKLLNENKSS